MPTQSFRRARRRLPWMPVALASLLAAATLAPGAIAAGTAPTGAGGKVVPPKSGTWVGAYEAADGTQQDKKDRLLALESMVGGTLDVDHRYADWTSDFPGWRETWDTQKGRIPFVSWGKASTSAINSGHYDGMIRQRAAEVKQAGFPILLEWFWEMDGPRNDYLAGSPATFVSAWRRIHTLFDKAGATNVSWVWCPNAWGFATGDAQKYYPGDAYVDWICANGYNWAPGRGDDKWRSFEWIFQPFYDWAAGRGKPLMVGEFGAQERGPGEKAQWLRDATATLQTKFTAIKAVVYFDVEKVYDWRIRTSAGSARAFKAMVNTLDGGSG